MIELKRARTSCNTVIKRMQSEKTNTPSKPQKSDALATMPREEALNILNLKSNFTPSECKDRFIKCFNQNKIENGSSLYIQSKCVRAYETLCLKQGDKK